MMADSRINLAKKKKMIDRQCRSLFFVWGHRNINQGGPLPLNWFPTPHCPFKFAMGRKIYLPTPPNSTQWTRSAPSLPEKKEALAYIFLFELPKGRRTWVSLECYESALWASTMAGVELSHLTTMLKHSTPPADKFFEREHSVFGFIDRADMVV